MKFDNDTFLFAVIRFLSSFEKKKFRHKAGILRNSISISELFSLSADGFHRVRGHAAVLLPWHHEYRPLPRQNARSRRPMDDWRQP